MTPHPAKTKAQRRVLDEIGCGNFSPPMARATSESMLANGLIVQCGTKLLFKDRFGEVYQAEYEMPIPVHMQWCSHWAEQEDTPQ